MPVLCDVSVWLRLEGMQAGDAVIGAWNRWGTEHCEQAQASSRFDWGCGCCHVPACIAVWRDMNGAVVIVSSWQQHLLPWYMRVTITPMLSLAVWAWELNGWEYVCLLTTVVEHWNYVAFLWTKRLLQWWIQSLNPPRDLWGIYWSGNVQLPALSP